MTIKGNLSELWKIKDHTLTHQRTTGSTLERHKYVDSGYPYAIKPIISFKIEDGILYYSINAY